MANNFHHIPVLLNEAVDALEIEPGKKYIDATVGGGGHTSEILKRGGLVLGLDQDSEATEFVKQTLESNIKNKELRVIKSNFRDIKQIALENGFGQVDGILFDLGVSSYQLDSSNRGFSIRHDETLDMRMDQSSLLSAYEVVNKYSFDRLVDIFYRYGEEHNARKIAEEIVSTRKRHPIITTKELASICERISHKSEAIHPATRVFQAIRIEVNEELDALRQALEASFELLNKNGRMVVFSFHSLEDRIVKKTYEKWKRKGLGTVLSKKPLTATFEELSKNKRARSAKLRIFEKV